MPLGYTEQSKLLCEFGETKLVLNYHNVLCDQRQGVVVLLKLAWCRSVSLLKHQATHIHANKKNISIRHLNLYTMDPSCINQTLFKKFLFESVGVKISILFL